MAQVGPFIHISSPFRFWCILALQVVTVHVLQLWHQRRLLVAQASHFVLDKFYVLFDALLLAGGCDAKFPERLTQPVILPGQPSDEQHWIGPSFHTCILLMFSVYFLCLCRCQHS